MLDTSLNDKSNHASSLGSSRREVMVDVKLSKSEMALLLNRKERVLYFPYEVNERFIINSTTGQHWGRARILRWWRKIRNTTIFGRITFTLLNDRLGSSSKASDNKIISHHDWWVTRAVAAFTKLLQITNSYASCSFSACLYLVTQPGIWTKSPVAVMCHL